MLNAIGFWIGDLRDQKLAAPQELVGAMPADQRARLGDYLAAGMTHEQYFGVSWCRFGCGISPSLMGSRDLTDGTWVWPEGLAHYVREHEIVLPDEFVRHALFSTTPALPVGKERDFVSRPREQVDYVFWHGWCSARRSQQLLDRLRAGMLIAEGLAAGDMAANRAHKIAALSSERGFAEANCHWRGCDQKALAGMYICADHYLGDEDPDPAGRMQAELKKILGELSGAVRTRRVRLIIANGRTSVLEHARMVAIKCSRVFRR